MSDATVIKPDLDFVKGVVGLSGTLAYLTRLAGIGVLAYPFYFIHLVFVFSLFIYLPFSKLAHMFYRGAAICFNTYSGREARAAAVSQPPAEVTAETEAAEGAGSEAKAE